MGKFSKLHQETILAGAIGDAFGYIIEFSSWDMIQRTYGVEGLSFSHFVESYPVWEVSDDTQMTLFCLDSLFNDASSVNSLKKKLFDDSIAARVDDLYDAYHEWYLTQQESTPVNEIGLRSFASLHKRQAPGNTCMASLRIPTQFSIARRANNSKGCGGIMRVAPVGFLPMDNSFIFELGCEQAALTHGHPFGYLSAGYFALLIRHLIAGASFKEAVAGAAATALAHPLSARHAEMIDIVQTCELIAADYSRMHPEFVVNKYGQGWTGETALYVALYSAVHASSFSDLLYLSANHSGDSDSTASLAAQLYVAKNGLSDEVVNMAKERLDVIDVMAYTGIVW